MKLGLCTIAFRDRPIEQAIELAVECGYDGIEVWGQEGHLPAHSGAATVKLVRDIACEHGLEIFAYGSYLRLLTDEFDSQMGPVLDVTVRLGTRLLRIWGGGCPSGQADGGLVKAAVAQLKDLCAQAAEVGVTVAFENHDGGLADSAEMILQLIERTGAVNLKTYFQPSWRRDADDPYEAMAKMLPHVVNVHAQNFRGEYGRRTQLADGDVDYAVIVDSLKRGGYGGPIEVEFVGETDPVEWAWRDLEFLRSIT